MEDQIIDDSSFGTGLNDQMRSYLQETAKWTYFLSILGFIFLGLMVLGSLVVGMMFGSMTRELGYGNSGGLITLLYLGGALLYFFPVLYLFKFSTKAQTALRSGNEGELTDAFQNLKSHYKFVGILTIVLLGFYLLFFLFGGLGALMMG